MDDKRAQPHVLTNLVWIGLFPIERFCALQKALLWVVVQQLFCLDFPRFREKKKTGKIKINS